MSMILYHGEPNGPSLAVLAALAETGLDVECRKIDLLAGERHTLPDLDEPVARDMGVEGEGPVLVIDGEAMTESVFIAQFLDEVAGGAGLQPRDPYAHWQMLMWCRRITERAAPAQAYLGCRDNAHAVLAAMDDFAFGALTGRIASEDLRQRWIDLRTGTFPADRTSDSLAKRADGIAMIEDQLGDGRDWLMGDFSIADLETYGWFCGMEAEVSDRPRTLGWLQRMKARASVQWALSLAGAAHPERSWAPGPEINRWG